MPKNDLYLAMDILDCYKKQHRFKMAWSDKTPMKMNIICETCCDENPGRTAYVAYGVQSGSFGQWRRRSQERNGPDDSEFASESDVSES